MKLVEDIVYNIMTRVWLVAFGILVIIVGIISPRNCINGIIAAGGNITALRVRTSKK